MLFRFLRTGGSVGELMLRDFAARMKEVRAGRGVFLAAGDFSEQARAFVAGAPDRPGGEGGPGQAVPAESERDHQVPLLVQEGHLQADHRRLTGFAGAPACASSAAMRSRRPL